MYPDGYLALASIIGQILEIRYRMISVILRFLLFVIMILLMMTIIYGIFSMTEVLNPQF